MYSIFLYWNTYNEWIKVCNVRYRKKMYVNMNIENICTMKFIEIFYIHLRQQTFLKK